MKAISHTHTGPRGLGAITALLLTALLLAGCGSSKGPTVAQFTHDIDAECQSIKSDTSAAAKAKAIENGSSSTAVKSEKLLAFTAPYYEKFKAIKPPAGDTTAEAMHDAYAAIDSAIATVDSAAKANDTTRLDSAGTQIKDNETVLTSDYKKIGASACE